MFRIALTQVQHSAFGLVGLAEVHIDTPPKSVQIPLGAPFLPSSVLSVPHSLVLLTNLLIAGCSDLCSVVSPAFFEPPYNDCLPGPLSAYFMDPSWEGCLGFPQAGWAVHAPHALKIFLVTRRIKSFENKAIKAVGLEGLCFGGGSVYPQVPGLRHRLVQPASWMCCVVPSHPHCSCRRIGTGNVCGGAAPPAPGCRISNVPCLSVCRAA